MRVSDLLDEAVSSLESSETDFFVVSLHPSSRAFVKVRRVWKVQDSARLAHMEREVEALLAELREIASATGRSSGDEEVLRG